MSHERNRCIAQHPRDHTFVVKPDAATPAAHYHGVAATIRRKLGGGKRKRAAAGMRRPSWTSCRKTGRAHGCKVHRQIAEVAENQRRLDASDTDGCVLKVFQWMADRRWVLLASEFKIWDERVHCATAIDAICHDTRANKVMLVEWKTGHLRRQWLNADGPFKRHALQVALAQVILEKRYGVPTDAVGACVCLINQRVNLSCRRINEKMKRDALAFYGSLRKQASS